MSDNDPDTFGSEQAHLEGKMKKTLAISATVLLAVLAFAVPAGAQDPVVGDVTSDPATVAEAGEATVTASGSGFLPDSILLLGSCVSPADELVPGVSSTDEIIAAAGAITIDDCDLAGALQVTTDADGNFSQEVTADIGPNFFLTAGTLDASQTGAVWIPVVDPALAVTGVDSGVVAIVGLALLIAGAVAFAASRRFTLA